MSPARVHIVLATFAVLSLAMSVNMLTQHRTDRLATGPSASGATTPAPGADAPAVAASPVRPEDRDTLLVRAVQRELVQHGYAAGAPDGVPGLMTSAAILAFEYDHGLPLTAEPSEGLLQALVLGRPRAPGIGSHLVSERAGQIIRTVQTSLKGLGYEPGAVDGKLSPQTVAAITRFEADRNLQRTGRISAILMRELAASAGQGRMALVR